MSRKKANDHCHRFTFNLCNEAADIILKEQANSIMAGRFRGRGRIIEMMILQWNQANLSLSDLGTDSRETGSI